jgi:arachidonate 15-lipoxygenase
MAREEYLTVPSSPDDGQPTMQSPTTPILPQHDPNYPQRQDYLKYNREVYEFGYPPLAPIPVLKNLPEAESLPPKLFLKRRLDKKIYELTSNFASKIRSFFDHFDSIEDYEDLFSFLPKPDENLGNDADLIELFHKPDEVNEVIKTYQNDRIFAEQRLSGVNPLVIKKLAVIPDNLLNVPVKSSLDLQEELKKGNLYLTDYTVLAPVQGGTYGRGKKYLPKPMALFWWRGSDNGQGELVPLAIQLDVQRKESIFTPSDTDWQIAKLCLQVADANHHEMITHLCRTHFAMEPIAIVTARQLAANHPLSVLLHPHFRFMLGYNYRGREVLINEGGAVDRLLAGTLAESIDLIKEGYRRWSFDQFAFPKEIENRGMNDIPHYPYRDDGLLVWDAVRKFVSEYLKLYYATPEDITEDTELQAWAQEMVSDSGGKVKGFPQSFENLDSLVEAVTNIIFTCGPQHSAINSPQYEYMAFVPNMPLAAYRPIPEKGQPHDGLLQFLPPEEQAIGQMRLIRTLSTYFYDHLGGYQDNDFTDPKVQDVVSQFKQDLNYVELKIDEKNRSRTVAYQDFKPSYVLNSISA